MAALFYTEPFSTFDLDVFIIFKTSDSPLISLSPLYRFLKSLGYSPEGECVSIEGTPVQFLPAYNELVEEAVTNAVEKRYGSTKTWVLSPEYLIALAVQTGRRKDQSRVQLLLEEANINMVLLKSIFDKYSLDKRWIPWTT